MVQLVLQIDYWLANLGGKAIQELQVMLMERLVLAELVDLVELVVELLLSLLKQ